LVANASSTSGRRDFCHISGEINIGHYGFNVGRRTDPDPRVGVKEADQVVDRFAIRRLRLPVRVLAQCMSRIVKPTLRDQWQLMQSRLVHRLAQDVAVAEAGRFRHQLRVMERELAMADPEPQILRVGLEAASHDVAAIEVAGVLFRSASGTAKPPSAILRRDLVAARIIAEE